jgi:hypothetical protein
VVGHIKDCPFEAIPELVVVVTMLARHPTTTIPIFALQLLRKDERGPQSNISVIDRRYVVPLRSGDATSPNLHHLRQEFRATTSYTGTLCLHGAEWVLPCLSRQAEDTEQSRLPFQ